MSKHVPEPWHTVAHSWSETGIYPLEGARIAVCEIDPNVTEDTQEELEPIMDANARRIVACVNSCKDISTEALEGGVVSELLEALRELLACQYAQCPPFEDGRAAQDEWADRMASARNNAAAAIAKATGKEPQ